jgi:hypothetical protein
MTTLLVVACGCGFPRPMELAATDGGGGGTDAAIDSGDSASQLCAPGQPLRCDGSSLVSCNGDGSAEASQACALGCNATASRCNDVDPSNGLAPFLDMAATGADVDLGASATINTDDGTVQVDGAPLMITSSLFGQTDGPNIRVFVVHSLTAADVATVGSNALVFVSDRDITIHGTLSVSGGHNDTPSPGGFNDATCQGQPGTFASDAFGGSGGGGFGSRGGNGGSATNSAVSEPGGSGGAPTSNVSLTPLRGGCDSGTWGGALIGRGGGAVQLVSRTTVALASGAVIAANGASLSGGGSGGGILLEAPLVEVTGNVVANGAAGSDVCILAFSAGEDGHLDARPAIGAPTCTDLLGSRGGNGAAGSSEATNGTDVTGNGSALFPGNGAGGVGRIRVNAIAGGLSASGIFSPTPSIGVISVR